MLLRLSPGAYASGVPSVLHTLPEVGPPPPRADRLLLAKSRSGRADDAAESDEWPRYDHREPRAGQVAWHVSAVSKERTETPALFSCLTGLEYSVHLIAHIPPIANCEYLSRCLLQRQSGPTYLGTQK